MTLLLMTKPRWSLPMAIRIGHFSTLACAIAALAVTARDSCSYKSNSATRLLQLRFDLLRHSVS